MKASFKHKIKGGFKNGQFAAEVEKGEELAFMEDVLEAARMMETQGWTPDLDSVKITSDASSIMHAPLFDTPMWQTYVELQESQSGTLLEYAKDILLERPGRPPTEQVGSSKLDTKRGFLAHVWKTSVGAGNFSQSWERIWKVVRDHRIIGLVPLCCATFSLQGEFISVVPIPSVYVKDVEPHQLPLNAEDGGNDVEDVDMASHLARTLVAALGLKHGTKMNFWKGLDGRFYALHMKAVLGERLENGYNVARKELVARRQLAGKQEVPLMEYIRSTAIPQTITALVKQMSSLEAEGLATGAELVKEGHLRAAMKSCGVNMCFLFEVRSQAGVRSQAASTETEQRHLVEIAIACTTEMLGRTLKHMVRTDIQNFKLEGKKSEEHRLDCANRIARHTLTKDEDFWRDHINPGIRRKYATPDDFSITGKDCHLPSVLRVMSTKVGCVFTDAGRFANFVELTSATMSWHEVPELLQDVLGADEKKEGLEKAWADVKVFPTGGVLQQCYLIKAINTSILSQEADVDPRTDIVIKQWECLKSAAARACLMAVAVELNPPKRSAQLYSYFQKDLLDLGKSAAKTSTEDLTSTLCGYYYLYLAKLKGEDRVSTIQHSCALSNTTKCMWVDMVYHPLIRPMMEAVEQRFDGLNEENAEYYCDAVRSLVSHYVAQGTTKLAAAEFIRTGVIVSSEKNPNALEQRRAFCATGAEVLKAAQGPGGHDYFLLVFCTALLAAQSSENDKLLSIIKELVEKAAFRPAGPVERVKHRTALEFLAKKPATIEALRVCVRYSEDKAKTTLEEYIAVVDKEGGGGGSGGDKEVAQGSATPTADDETQKMKPPEGSPITDDQHMRMVDFYNEVMVAKDKYGQFSPEYYTKLYGLARHVNKVMTKNPKIETTMTLLATRCLGVSETVPWDQRGASDDYRKMLDQGKAKAPVGMIKKLAGLDTIPTEVQTALSEHLDYVANITTDQEIEAATKWAPQPKSKNPSRNASQNPSRNPTPDPDQGSATPADDETEFMKTPEGSPITDDQHMRLVDFYNEVIVAKDKYGQFSPEYYTKVYGLARHVDKVITKNPKIEKMMTLLATRCQVLSESVPWDQRGASDDYRKILDEGKAKTPVGMIKKLAGLNTIPTEVQTVLSEHADYVASITTDQEIEAATKWAPQPQSKNPSRNVSQNPSRNPTPNSADPSLALSNDGSLVEAGGDGYDPDDPRHRKMIDMCIELDETTDLQGRHSPEYYLRIYGIVLEANAASLNMDKIEQATTVLSDRAREVSTHTQALADSEDYRKMLSDSRAKAPGQIIRKLATVEKLPQRVRDLFNAHMAHVVAVSIEEEIDAAMAASLSRIKKKDTAKEEEGHKGGVDDETQSAHGATQEAPEQQEGHQKNPNHQEERHSHRASPVPSEDQHKKNSKASSKASSRQPTPMESTQRTQAPRSPADSHHETTPRNEEKRSHSKESHRSHHSTTPSAKPEPKRRKESRKDTTASMFASWNAETSEELMASQRQQQRDNLSSSIFGAEVIPGPYSPKVLNEKKLAESMKSDKLEASRRARLQKEIGIVRAKPKVMIYCPIATRPLDKHPEVAPPEETTPCFEIKFSSKIPPHPCEAQMRKKDALRRAQAAMEMAQRGKGRHGVLDRLEKIPTLRSDLSTLASPAKKDDPSEEPPEEEKAEDAQGEPKEDGEKKTEDGEGNDPEQSGESPSRSHYQHTMLIGPTHINHHKHVHISQDRRRPHSSNEVVSPAVTAVCRKPHRDAFTPEPRTTTPSSK